MNRLALFVSAPLLALPIVARSQTPNLAGAAKLADSAAHLINAAHYAGDTAGLNAARTLLDRALVTYPNDPLLLHYQGYELFREVNLRQALQRSAGFGSLLESARLALSRSDSLKPMAETHALLSTVLGQMIGANQSLGPVIGPQVQQEMQAALSVGPNNPRVWLLRGIAAIYTPPEYGGGISIAETQLNKAVELFATDRPIAPAPSWGRAEAYAWLGIVLKRENKTTDAAAAFTKALQLEPNYIWVKSDLLPSVTK
jgi:tetratricopeptide (TPR) repeat protein